MIFETIMGDLFEKVSCKLEVTQGENVQTQDISAPPYAIQDEFIRLMQQAGQVGSPIKVKFYYFEPIYDPFEDKFRDVEHSLSFMNNAYRDVHREECGDA